MLRRQIEVTVFSRDNCQLCKVMIKLAGRVRSEIPFNLTIRMIDEDPVLLLRYGDRVPVFLVDDLERLSGRVTETQIRRVLKWARWTRPVSRILSRIGLSPTRG